MSLNAYQSLKDNSDLDDTTQQAIGVTLPTLTAATLNLSGQIVNAQTLQTSIDSFAPDNGWIMYRDELVVSNATPQRPDFVEAEYNRGEDSLQIKFIGHDRYQLSHYVVSAADEHNPTQCYRDIYPHLRSTLRPHGKAHYRLWFEQQTQGTTAGAWQPIGQQFLGFCPSNSGAY